MYVSAGDHIMCARCACARISRAYLSRFGVGVRYPNADGVEVSIFTCNIPNANVYSTIIIYLYFYVFIWCWWHRPSNTLAFQFIKQNGYVLQEDDSPASFSKCSSSRRLVMMHAGQYTHSIFDQDIYVVRHQSLGVWYWSGRMQCVPPHAASKKICCSGCALFCQSIMFTTFQNLRTRRHAYNVKLVGIGERGTGTYRHTCKRVRSGIILDCRIFTLSSALVSCCVCVCVAGSKHHFIQRLWAADTLFDNTFPFISIRYVYGGQPLFFEVVGRWQPRHSKNLCRVHERTKYVWEQREPMHIWALLPRPNVMYWTWTVLYTGIFSLELTHTHTHSMAFMPAIVCLLFNGFGTVNFNTQTRTYSHGSMGVHGWNELRPQRTPAIATAPANGNVPSAHPTIWHTHCLMACWHSIQASHIQSFVWFECFRSVFMFVPRVQILELCLRNCILHEFRLQ